MSSSSLRDVMRGAAVVLLVTLLFAVPALAAEVHDTIRVAVGHLEVIPSPEDVTTVAIAEPEIADAAVGSPRTVLLTAKKAGSTNLVIYNQGGRYKIYDVVVYVPNQEMQILLHVTVAEVTDRAKLELGMDFWGDGTTENSPFDGTLGGGLYTTKMGASQYPLFEPNPPSTADGMAAYSRNDGHLNFQVAWKALQESGDISVLAQPSVLARSGEEASFLSGGEFAYQIITGVGAGAVPAIQFK